LFVSVAMVVAWPKDARAARLGLFEWQLSGMVSSQPAVTDFPRRADSSGWHLRLATALEPMPSVFLGVGVRAGFMARGVPPVWRREGGAPFSAGLDVFVRHAADPPRGPGVTPLVGLTAELVGSAVRSWVGFVADIGAQFHFFPDTPLQLFASVGVGGGPSFNLITRLTFGQVF